VYIIDEVHMLTDAAFNALLKTLEEPPSSVVFIFATTEPAKVPATIRSRCQHIPFHRIDAAVIVPRVRDVASREGAVFDERALWDIAREADGSLRDALSLLEQALSLGSDVSTEKLRSLFGGGSRKDLESFVSLLRTDRKEAFMELNGSFRKGLTGQRLLEGLFSTFRDLWIVKKWGDQMTSQLPLAEEESRFIIEESDFWSEKVLWKGMEFFASMMPRARRGLRSDVLGGLLFGFFDRIFAVEGETPAKATGTALLKENESAPKNTSSASPPVAGQGQSEKTVSEDVSSLPERLVAESAEKHKPPATNKDSFADKGKEQDMDPKLWKDFLESFFPDDLGLHCALLSARPKAVDGTIRISFDEDDRLCFEMSKTGRNLAKIATRRNLFGESSKLLLCCGEDEIEVESHSFLDLNQAEEKAVKEAGGGDNAGKRKTSRKKTGESAGKSREGKEPGEKGEKNRNAGELDTVMSLFDAELLFVREELAENGESGGDIVE
jgi:DNA polymerase-3 subunit gamma/tau